MRGIILFLIMALCNICYAETNLHKLSNEICEGLKTDEKKVIALREAVYNKMKPNGNGHTLDEVRSNNLEWAWENGVGWCDHQANVFMMLAREQGITTRLMYLLNADLTSSPHTIAEAKLGNRWVVVDVGNNIDYRYYGKMATRNDMGLAFNEIVMGNEEVKKMGGDEEYWRMFTNFAYMIKVLEP